MFEDVTMYTHTHTLTHTHSHTHTLGKLWMTMKETNSWVTHYKYIYVNTYNIMNKYQVGVVPFCTGLKSLKSLHFYTVS